MATVTAAERQSLVINPSTREILVPKSERVFGAYNDDGVDKKTFLCPKLIGNNIDMTECFIFVNYISSGGNEGQILCENVEVTADNACVKFDWELTSNVFDENRDATIYFSVHAKKVENGKLRLVFATKIAQGRSYATVDSTGEVLQKNADVIVQLLERVIKLEGKTTEESLEKAFEKYFSDNPSILAEKIPINETLKVTEDGKLAVNTTDEVSQDNTQPVTSGAVYKQVGDINSLLETI